MPDKSTHLLLPVQLAEQIAQYIVNSPSPTLPVSQAMALVQGLQQLQPAQAEPPEES